MAWSATVALIAFAYFLIAVVALYFLNPQYTLFRSFTAWGDYDIGPHKFLIASTYFGLGLGSLALAVGLYRGMSRSVLSGIGLLLLGIWGVGIVIAGVFPTDNPGSTVTHLTTVLLAGVFPVTVEATPETGFGLLHVAASYLSLLGLALAAVLLSWRFRQDERWFPFHRSALILALAMMAASIWMLCEIFFALVTAVEAASLRLLIVTGLTWLFLTAARLRFVVAGSVSK